MKKNPSNTPSGLLLIDKPQGITSHDVVQKVRKLLQTRSVGHAGTLDPLASGLLVLLIGQATKLSQYILSEEKGYRFTVEIGRSSDTLDITGNITQEVKDLQIDQNELIKAAESLTGEFDWPVPEYSAVKVNGKKLYEYARKGQDVPEVIKTMSFYDVYVHGVKDNSIEVSLRCSKGSYIRSWAQHLGEVIGEPSLISILRRTWSAPHYVEDAITLDDLEALPEEERKNKLLSLSECLPTWPKFEVHGQALTLLKNGNLPGWLAIDAFKSLTKTSSAANMGVRVVDRNSGQLVSLLVKNDNGKIGIGRVFNEAFP
jgi:tRNA pseudouridine55 synthase